MTYPLSPNSASAMSLLAHDLEMESINNESGGSYQVTWTPPSKGARGRRRNYVYFETLCINLCSYQLLFT